MSRSGKYITQLRGYKAFVPTPLPPKPPLHIDEVMNEKLIKANDWLLKLDGLAMGLPNADLFIAMYLKKEALISSQIEGTQASLEDLFEFDQGIVHYNINDVQEVVNYIKSLNYGIERLQTLPLPARSFGDAQDRRRLGDGGSLRLIKELHAILLEQTRGKDKTPGEFKRSQNWIGPTNSTLANALYVPPSPEDTVDALSSFEEYLYAPSSYPELIDCALLHYQFETIHPFLDGNGRVGRLLIILFLFWKKKIQKPILYVSYYLKLHRQEYYDRLMMVRTSGNYEQWVNFFLDAITAAAQAGYTTIGNILALKEKHFELLWTRKISTSLAPQLLDQLFFTPIVSIDAVVKQFSVSYPTAAKIVRQFEDAGILKEITQQKRSKRFAYTEYLKLLNEGAQPLAE